MEQIFTSKKSIFQRIFCYYITLFLIPWPILFFVHIYRAITQASIEEATKSIPFLIATLIWGSFTFFYCKNYRVKINETTVSVFFPFGIPRKKYYINNLSHYRKSKHPSIGSSEYYYLLSLFTNDKLLLQLNSDSYNNGVILIEQLIKNLRTNPFINIKYTTVK
jgi:hypothetical protein